MEQQNQNARYGARSDVRINVSNDGNFIEIVISKPVNYFRKILETAEVRQRMQPAKPVHIEKIQE